MLACNLFARATLALALSAAVAGSAVAQFTSPGAIRTGTPGFGYSGMSGTIGIGTGYGQAGYVFIPTLGFRPSFTGSGRDLLFFPPESRGKPVRLHPERRAAVTVKAPGLTDVWVGRHWAPSWGQARVFFTQELTEGKDSYIRVRAAWNDGSMNLDQTRLVKVRPGEKVTIDFSQPEAR
jgi:uncharacterized protein (TIGR03000 family)